MQLGPYSLIARVLGAPFGLWIAQKRIYDGTFDIIRPLAPGLVPIVLMTLPIPATNPRFPYGAIVIAD